MARAHHQSQALFGGKVIREPRRMLDRDAGFTPKRPGNRWGTGISANMSISKLALRWLLSAASDLYSTPPVTHRYLLGDAKWF
jgi:hypothetical protein